MIANQCMDCRRWFTDGGQIVKEPMHTKEVSHGLCPDCFIERTATFQPHTLDAWVNSPRTTPEMILNQLAFN